MKIGNNIKELRVQKNLTQEQLAYMIYVTPQAVSRWENNEDEPSIDSLKRMSILFSCSIDRLINENNEATPVSIISNTSIVPPIVNKKSNFDDENNVIENDNKSNLNTLNENTDKFSNLRNFVSVEPINKNNDDDYHLRKLHPQPSSSTCHCTSCNKLIDANKAMYKTINGNSIPFCFNCYTKTIDYKNSTTNITAESSTRKISPQKKNKVYTSRKYAKRAYWMAILFGVIFILIPLIYGLNHTFKVADNKGIFLAFIPLYFYSGFSLGYCLFDKTWIEDVLLSILVHACIKWPTLIISLSLDGLKTLIIFKLVTALISFVVGIIVFTFGILVSAVLSMVVFPFYANKDGASE